MNMPLFVNDIKAIGCDCEAICAAINELDDFFAYIKNKKFDLIASEAIINLRPETR